MLFGVQNHPTTFFLIRLLFIQNMFLVFPSCLGWWLITANEETVEHLLVSTSLLFPGQSPTCSFSTLSIEVWRCQSACDCLEPATGFRRTVAQEVLNRFHWRSEDSHHPNGSFCWDHSWAKHLWLQPMGWWRTDIPHGKAPKSGCCLTTEGPDKTGPVWLCMCDDTTVSVVDFSQRQHPPCRESIKKPDSCLNWTPISASRATFSPGAKSAARRRGSAAAILTAGATRLVSQTGRYTPITPYLSSFYCGKKQDFPNHKISGILMDLGVSIFRTNGFGIHNWNEILYNSGTKFGMLSTNRNDKECLLYLEMGILVYRYTQEVPFIWVKGW